MSVPDTPQPTHPAHCTHCIKLTSEAACEIWQRVTGETIITAETLTACRVCDWKDCVVSFQRKPNLHSASTSDYATALEGK